MGSRLLLLGWGFPFAFALHNGADKDDAFSFFPGDPRPVVWVGGVGEVFVFLEFVVAGGEEVFDL